MTTKIKVLLADTNEDFRELLGKQIDAEPDLETIGAAENGEQALQLVRELDPDVLVTDVICETLPDERHGHLHAQPHPRTFERHGHRTGVSGSDG